MNSPVPPDKAVHQDHQGVEQRWPEKVWVRRNGSARYEIFCVGESNRSDRTARPYVPAQRLIEVEERAEERAEQNSRTTLYWTLRAEQLEDELRQAESQLRALRERLKRAEDLLGEGQAALESTRPTQQFAADVSADHAKQTRQLEALRGALEEIGGFLSYVTDWEGDVGDLEDTRERLRAILSQLDQPEEGR